MYDIVMIVGDETNAGDNWQRLHALTPAACRVSGASTIKDAYANAAQAASTPYFFAVDGDNWLLEDFGFETDLVPETDETLIWNARNPVNGLVYGHGGIKLLPTERTRRIAELSAVDVTISVGDTTRFVPVTASEHRFNASPFETWRAAFRECAKLASHSMPGMPEHLRIQWLEVWCTKGAVAPFGNWCLLGAQEGRLFGQQFAANRDAIRQVNDFRWLRQRFDQFHRGKV